jgi:hypothetical protein
MLTGPRLGRLCNHSKKGPAQPRIIDVDSSPRLCLFAKRHMVAGQQVLYNYGVKNLPFNDQVCLSHNVGVINRLILFVCFI